MARTAQLATQVRLSEWRRLGFFYGAILGLHILGWGLYLHYVIAYPSLVGLGFVAYLFGLRHAFDADHISAIDDTIRYLLQRDPEGEKPLGTGFFFSLGHSSIVFLLSLAIVFAAPLVRNELPILRRDGAIIGACVSGLFLWTIGIMNLLVLVDLMKVWKGAKAGNHTHGHVEDLLGRRGSLNRIFGDRLRGFVLSTWQMYPLGMLFGLGFDTASEIALLGMTAGASAGNLPALAILSIPVLFAAGMSLLDTTDGVMMCHAYRWALVYPLRKLVYNLSTTALSVLVALLIGAIELIQVLTHVLRLRGAFFVSLSKLDFGRLGYLIVALFLLTWIGSVLLWKGRQPTQAAASLVHAHPHTHDNGTRHDHRHLH